MSVVAFAREVLIEKKMSIIECASCQIDFGIGAGFQARRRNDHQTFYCPNGHSNVYREGTSEAEKRAAQAERELEAARSLAQRESRRRERAESSARSADYRARAAKGQLTKTRKRIAAGVCPCCQRTVSQLANHMATEHPGFPSEEA